VKTTYENSKDATNLIEIRIKSTGFLGRMLSQGLLDGAG
jgi:hypothetical protein